MSTSKAMVSERALAARVGRMLQASGRLLRKCKADSRWFVDLGAYYVVDCRSGMVTGRDVDLEALASELGAIKDYEALAR